jgi:transcription elongation GreA/GreB family factor
MSTSMVDETLEALRAEIDHHRRLAQLVTDAGVRAEIEKMIEELERRLRELEERRTATASLSPPKDALTASNTK